LPRLGRKRPASGSRTDFALRSSSFICNERAADLSWLALQVQIERNDVAVRLFVSICNNERDQYCIAATLQTPFRYAAYRNISLDSMRGVNCCLHQVTYG
jgi:hypothetical protein